MDGAWSWRGGSYRLDPRQFTIALLRRSHFRFRRMLPKLKAYSTEKKFLTANGWFDHMAYREFIEATNTRFSKSILELLPPNRFDRDLESSFCDSIFSLITVQVNLSAIELTYLGPYFDRSYKFWFSDVSEWKFTRFLGLAESLLRLTVHQHSNELLFVFRPKRDEGVMTIRARQFRFEERLFRANLDREYWLKWTGVQEFRSDVLCSVSSPDEHES